MNFLWGPADLIKNILLKFGDGLTPGYFFQDYRVLNVEIFLLQRRLDVGWKSESNVCVCVKKKKKKKNHFFAIANEE